MRRVILLGLLQGPTEMAPISSSAHTALLAQQSDPHLEKSFEVALHGGTALALALAMRRTLRDSWSRACTAAGSSAARSRLRLLALSLVPPALAGAAFERPIERRLRGRRAIATGLLLGGAAMATAERRDGTRTVEQAGVVDGLALGLAQAAALVPGVSRRGATIAAARLRGFARADADALSWLTALPVIAGACTLKAVRLAGEPSPQASRDALLAGAGAAFGSTLISARLASRLDLASAPLTPFCIYRLALAICLARGERLS